MTPDERKALADYVATGIVSPEWNASARGSEALSPMMTLETKIDLGLTPDQRSALARFLEDVRRMFGQRLIDVVVFGSRARGDFGADSDLDLAIVLRDGEWDYWAMKRKLSDTAYDTLIDLDLYIQSWPVRHSVWHAPELHTNRRLIENMRRDGISLLGAQ